MYFQVEALSASEGEEKVSGVPGAVFCCIFLIVYIVFFLVFFGALIELFMHT